MSSAASAILRILIARAGVPRERILLIDVQSIDWQSLTFTGERHHMTLRITGDAPALALSRMCTGLEDAEFSLPGVIVADIAVVGEPERAADGSMIVTVEALTVSDD